jgi:hypothetical protein
MKARRGAAVIQATAGTGGLRVITCITIGIIGFVLS